MIVHKNYHCTFSIKCRECPLEFFKPGKIMKSEKIIVYKLKLIKVQLYSVIEAINVITCIRKIITSTSRYNL
jgi:hypothetical protein